MTFLAPIFWLLSALAVPVVILYLVRQKPLRQRVSTLIFWRMGQRAFSENSRWRKVRNWVSLLLQLLFLFLLIAALTRPVWPGASALSKPVVMVLDGSASLAASVNGGNRRDLIVEKAVSFVDSLPSGSEAALWVSGPEPVLLSGWTDSRTELKNLIRGYATSDFAVDPGATLESARELADSRKAGVVFFTDSVWKGPLEPDLLGGVDLVRVEGPQTNAGIDLFAARRSPVLPGEVSVLLQVVSNTAGNVRLTISREGELVDAREIALEAGIPATWERTFRDPGAFNLSANVEGLSGDVLAVDDAETLSIPPMPALQTVLVSAPDLYLESALNAVPGIQVERIWPAGAMRFGDPAKLWVFRGFVPPPDFQGKGLVLIQPEENGFFGGIDGKLESAYATELISDSFLLANLSLSGFRTGEAIVYKPAPGSENFVATAEIPLVFGEWPREVGPSWLVFAFDPSDSDLVTKAAFPIMVTNLVQSLRGDPFETFRAAGASRELTLLSPQAKDLPGAKYQTAAIALPTHSLWWWLVLAGCLWLLAEWWTFQRRITE